MRLFLITFFLLNIASCSLHSQQVHFDKSRIFKIDLLVGDSTIFNEWQNHQDSGLMVLNGDVYFVEATGKTLHKPMQKVTFIDKGKDSLLDILNSFFPNNNDTLNKTCILLLRHSLLCYSKDNKLIGKADICFDCSAMVILSLQSQIDMDQNKKADQKLISLFKSRYVCLYHAVE